jgi:lipopolysaccharide biosynthesis glycosyltransferase
MYIHIIIDILHIFDVDTIVRQESNDSFNTKKEKKIRHGSKSFSIDSSRRGSKTMLTKDDSGRGVDTILYMCGFIYVS